MYQFNLSPDSASFVPDTEEKRRIAQLDDEIATLQKRKLDLLREIARSNGFSALKLEDLKSANGKPFVEETPRRSLMRIAIVEGKRLLTGPEILEMAYLCHNNRYAGNSQDSCGWVKGKPTERKYNDLGRLSGSAGTRYFCKICEKQIGELQTRVS